MSDVLTLQHIAKQTNNNVLINIAERMTQDNEIIQDAHWEEANDFTSHLFSYRVAIPQGNWRLFNQGVPAQASEIAQGRAFMGMHENPIKVDTRLLKASPDREAVWNREVLAHSEGSAQFLAEGVVYGNHNTNPAAFSGLIPQLDSLSMENVFDGGGSTPDSMSSILGIEWGPGKVYMVKPRGAKTPLEVTKRMEDYATDANGNEYKVVRCEVIFHCGLVVEDPRYVFRIANLDVTKKGDEAGAFNEDLLIEAINGCKGRGKGIKLYSNDNIVTMAEIRAKDKANVSYTSQEIFGNDVVAFKKRPFRLVEAMLNTEAVVA